MSSPIHWDAFSHHSGAVFPLRKFYTEQTFVLVHMQLCNHVDKQTVKCI